MSQKYVIKNKDLYLHTEIMEDDSWVEDISDATIFDEKDIDQNCVPTCSYVIDSLVRKEHQDAKLVEVKAFYRETQ
jgi:hypothetical protein